MTHALVGDELLSQSYPSLPAEPMLIASELLSPELRARRKPSKRVRLPAMPIARSRLVLDALTRLGRLQTLDVGWDGRRGQPTSDDAFAIAAGIIVELIVVNGPTLQMVPLPLGGVQLEWHVEGNDLEVEVSENGRINVLATISTGEDILGIDIPPALFSSRLREIKDFYGTLTRLLGES